MTMCIGEEGMLFRKFAHRRPSSLTVIRPGFHESVIVCHLVKFARTRACTRVPP